MIDWVKILNEHNIEFDEAPNDIYCHCPICGSADEGRHLAISLRDKGWHCWRNSQHRGRSPGKLLAILLGISPAQAFKLLGMNPTLVSDDDLPGRLAAMFEEPEAVPERTLCFPPEIKPLKIKESHKPFWEYLVDRHYTIEQVEELCGKHDLHCAFSGQFRYRVVMPIHTRAGFVTWTARTIVPNHKLRYLSLTAKPELANGGPCALIPIKDCVFNEYALFQERSNTLVVCEGPFDAMRLDYFGQRFGVRATALFGKAISASQLDVLAELSKRFKRRILLLDPDAALDNFGLNQSLEPLAFEVEKISDRWKDPAKMSAKAVVAFVKQVLP